MPYEPPTLMAVTPPVLPARPLVARAVRRRRQLKLARIRARASLRNNLLPPPTTRGRQRVDLRTAADTLHALGVRVEVIPPTTPWPRTGRFVLSDSTAWLGDLALVTAALDREPASEDGAVVVCPVSVRFRMPSGYLRPDEVPARPAEAAAADGLVVEVRCLPAIAAG